MRGRQREWNGIHKLTLDIIIGLLFPGSYKLNGWRMRGGEVT